jgi:hypothetical protein
MAGGLAIPLRVDEGECDLEIFRVVADEQIAHYRRDQKAVTVARCVPVQVPLRAIIERDTTKCRLMAGVAFKTSF